jgi:hypothetical protein
MPVCNRAFFDSGPKGRKGVFAQQKSPDLAKPNPESNARRACLPRSHLPQTAVFSHFKGTDPLKSGFFVAILPLPPKKTYFTPISVAKWMKNPCLSKSFVFKASSVFVKSTKPLVVESAVCPRDY